MFIAELFTTARAWNQSNCSLMDEWIKKMWSIRTMEYFSASKKKEIMPYATTWMILQDIMLSEVNHSQKDTYCMIPLT